MKQGRQGNLATMLITEDAAPSPAVGDPVLSTAVLEDGDLIQASYKGALVYRGQVTGIAPGDELLWITDRLTESRRLLDVSEFTIVRVVDTRRAP